MAVVSAFDRNTRIVRWEIVDPWTVDEVVEVVHRSLDDPMHFPDSGLLVDWRSARPPSDDEVRTWLARTSHYERLQPRHRAIVLPSDVVAAVLASSQATGNMNGVSIGVFTSDEEAEAWLTGLLSE